MPDLPTLTVTQAQMDKITSTFPGATLAEKSQAYKDWLTNRLVDRVYLQERRKAEDAAQASLPQRVPEPPIP